jgi:hypothetical protein
MASATIIKQNADRTHRLQFEEVNLGILRYSQKAVCVFVLLVLVHPVMCSPVA